MMHVSIFIQNLRMKKNLQGEKHKREYQDAIDAGFGSSKQCRQPIISLFSRFSFSLYKPLLILKFFMHMYA